MRRIGLIGSFLLLLALPHAFGQSGPTLVSAVPGYAVALPLSMRIAPGQVVTFQIAGLKTVLPARQVIKATTVPLPTTLSGISVTLNQYPAGQPSEAASYAVPLVAISQVNYCPSTSGTPNCLNTLTFLTVQIPFELLVAEKFAVPTTELVIAENGVGGVPFPVVGVTDSIHVLTTCDGTTVATSCTSIVTHADGTGVSASSPALPGETVVIYAFGLGQTTPAVKTGAAAPIPAPTVVGVGPTAGLNLNLQFDFGLNLAPSSSAMMGRTLGTNFPEFAGLTPGQVGLYQINVQLPAKFPSVAACASLVGNGYIYSNLTITIGGVSSFDGAAICVQPGQ